MPEQIFGIVWDSVTYTKPMLAKVLGYTTEEPIGEMLREGLPHFIRGKKTYINGKLFNMWVQQCSLGEAAE